MLSLNKGESRDLYTQRRTTIEQTTHCMCTFVYSQQMAMYTRTSFVHLPFSLFEEVGRAVVYRTLVEQINGLSVDTEQ